MVLIQTTLTLSQRVFGADTVHVNMPTTLKNIETVYYSKGEYDVAFPQVSTLVVPRQMNIHN